MEGSCPTTTSTVSAIRRRKRDARMSLLRQQASDQARSVTEQVLKLAEATIQQ